MRQSPHVGTLLAFSTVCTGVMVSLPQDTWVRLHGWTVLGLPIYFCFRFRHSVLREAGR